MFCGIRCVAQYFPQTFDFGVKYFIFVQTNFKNN